MTMEDLELLGSSPASVAALLDYNKQPEEQRPLGLEAFLQEIPRQIAQRKQCDIPAGSPEDPIMGLFR